MLKQAQDKLANGEGKKPKGGTTTVGGKVMKGGGVIETEMVLGQ